MKIESSEENSMMGGFGSFGWGNGFGMMGSFGWFGGFIGLLIIV
jgi:hypothetical protein